MEKIMSLHNGLSCICTLVGLFMPTLSAGPAVRESIKTLASGADAIVAGSVETTEVNGTVGAIIHVDRVLKGSVLKGSAISVTWTRPENPVAFGKGGASTSRGYGACRPSVFDS